MAESHSSNFRVITTNILGVRISRKFTVPLYPLNYKGTFPEWQDLLRMTHVHISHYPVDAQADLSLRWAHSHIVGFVTRRLISALKVRNTQFALIGREQENYFLTLFR